MTYPHPLANPLKRNALRTRSDVQQAARDLVTPLLPHFSAGRARVTLGSFMAWFSRADAELEGFARPLWGLAPLAAGGGEFAWWTNWRDGLVAGTDPEHPERWETYDAAQQTMVEQAAIAFALMLARAELWDPLDASARANLVRWLSLINRAEPFDNNWHFFRVLVNLGLAAVGGPTDEAAVERSLAKIDSYYLGDGWYADGMSGHRDHYIPWAFHVYGLIYAWARPNDPRSAVFRERARLFARQFRAWFDPCGGVVPFGRSLTYRFAAASFWGALAFASEEALSWGDIKGRYLRHLRWWRRWPISDRDGVLGLGWGYANPWLREHYNSPGSPYWAMKAFLPLALPGDHPFWTAEETPADPRPGVSVQVHPGMLLSGDESQVVALSGGHNAPQEYNQGAAKYAKFAYSSVFGFSGDVPDPLGFGPGPSDSMLQIHVEGRAVRVRERVDRYVLEDGMLYARWRPWPEVIVHTVLTGQCPWHVRLHRIETSLPLRTVEGGFALGCPDVGRYDARMETSYAIARSELGVSGLWNLVGSRQALVLPQGPNANLMHPCTVVPTLLAQCDAGVHDLACAVLGTDRPDAVNLSVPPGARDAAWRFLERESRKERHES